MNRLLKDEVKLLITIKGIAPLVALAFLAEVGNIKRFRTRRKMNAYLGIAPRIKGSGGKTQVGHITRESRNLTSTLLTQSIHHLTEASPYFRIFYENLSEKRGAGRARIALIRKVCGMVRRKLLTGECYRWMDNNLYVRKLKLYEKDLESIKRKKTA
ncbi:hypothetical protein DRJ04_09225 [Candidatus Aerophobetes bacterium]|uniref:Transposase IS116/IS110/IS902 C-terminal domain-containing protein n=1 Tax=Aerophobetes bacterium TaxID=2030807 RepID=A0A662D761_UNCAE|nr:MAG: hypothetical protein DRJ04_09225 [Candidatus Aerophobetes bacterium]